MDKPDYDFWAAQPLYSRINAAFLCCDLEPEDTPEGGYGPPKVAAMYARLGGHRKPLAKGDIWKIPGGKDYLMSRGFLREWAEVTGQRAAMPFLFPEDRENGEEETNAMRADTKEGYLFLIGLLVHALAERGGHAFNSNRGPKQSGILGLLEATAKRLGAPMDGLGKSQGNGKLSEALKEVRYRQK